MKIMIKKKNHRPLLKLNYAIFKEYYTSIHLQNIGKPMVFCLSRGYRNGKFVENRFHFRCKKFTKK